MQQLITPGFSILDWLVNLAGQFVKIKNWKITVEIIPTHFTARNNFNSYFPVLNFDKLAN